METSFLTSALQALPGIATSPLAFVGYALTLGAWVYTYNRAGNLKELMKQIAFVPEQDRKATIVASIGDPLPDNITAEQWIVSKRQQYFLVAFIVTAVVAIIISAITIFQGTQIQTAMLEKQARVDICERKVRNLNDQWKRSKAVLDGRNAELDQSLASWELEWRRGYSGLAFAPMDQKQMAIDIMKNAEAEINKLKKEKSELQAKIAGFAATQPTPVKCDA